MSCQVDLEEIFVDCERPDQQLYKVTLKTDYLLFFTKTQVFRNLTAEQVQQMAIPFVKRIHCQNVPFHVFPQNLIDHF